MRRHKEEKTVYNSAGIITGNIHYTDKFLNSILELVVKNLASSDLSQFSDKEMVP